MKVLRLPRLVVVPIFVLLLAFGAARASFARGRTKNIRASAASPSKATSSTSEVDGSRIGKPPLVTSRLWSAVETEAAARSPPVVSPTATTERRTVASTRTTDVHLLSLPPLTDALPQSVRALWRWKDDALGDGRDYFVPRPRAVRALNDLLVGSVGSASAGTDAEGVGVDVEVEVTECGALSNCARLDLVLVASSMTTSASDGRLVDADVEDEDAAVSLALRRAAAEVLASQLESHRRSASNPSFRGIASFLDLPGVVDSSAPPTDDRDLAEEISSLLVHVRTVERVSRHACLVAAGMAPRPSRPGRAVPFRPFSSRDAHVMLQMKRSAEVACGSTVKAVYDAALSAGKAARGEGCVPEISALREYGSGDTKYSLEPPGELTERARRAAGKLAVEPAVRKCRERVRAMAAAEVVSLFRSAVEDAVAKEYDLNGNDQVRRILQRLLHEPCMKLREGCEVDLNQVLTEIRRELKQKEEGRTEEL